MYESWLGKVNLVEVRLSYLPGLRYCYDIEEIHIVERWQTRWHIIVSARYPDRRTDRQTDRHTSPVLIVKLAVNIRPSQYNFGIPKQISEVWDFILYFYVFRWLVNQQHITAGIPKRLVLNSFEKSRRADEIFELWNLCFCKRQGFIVFSWERSGFEFSSYIFVLQLKSVGFGRWVFTNARVKSRDASILLFFT